MPHFLGQFGESWSYDDSRPVGDEGGMGQVFEGISPRDERVAVKRIRLASQAQSASSRTDREVAIRRTLNRLDSEYVVKMLDWAETDSEVLIVMPMADRSLAQAISTAQLSEPEKLDIIKQIAKGLMDLASLSIIYRDLKPANVLDFGGKWKLADFGISRDLNDATGTVTYAAFGTRAYVAPEIWEGRQPSAKSDLYALGVLSYELLVGKKPFPGPSDQEFATQHRFQVPPDMDQISPGIRRPVLRLLAKDPDTRPSDARYVVEEMERLSIPIPEELESLLLAIDIEQQEIAHGESLAALKAEVELAENRLRAQAKNDLEDLLRTTTDMIKRLYPETEFISLGNGWLMKNERLWLEIILWELSAEEMTTASEIRILAGTVRTSATSSHAKANVVFAKRDGRYSWDLVRFYNVRTHAAEFSWRRPRLRRWRGSVSSRRGAAFGREQHEFARPLNGFEDSHGTFQEYSFLSALDVQSLIQLLREPNY